MWLGRLWLADAVRRARSMTLGAVAAVALAGCSVGGGLPDGATGSLPRATGPGAADASAPAAGADGEAAGLPKGTRRAVGNAKVAMLLPMTAGGQTALIAKTLKQAGEMALFEQDNPGFQLIVKDDRGTPEGARSAAEEAVREGAELIIGPLLSRSVGAVAPVARAARVPVLAFSNDRQVAGSGVYLVSFLVRQEVERIVAYATSQGRRSFAALVPDDAYGQLTEAALREAAQASGAKVGLVERYRPDANGMIEPARRLVVAIRAGEQGPEPVDAVFLPGGADVLSSLGPLIAYASLDTSRLKLIGTGGWDAAGLGRDKTFIGGWYPSPDPRGWRAFSERFSRTFGTPPPRIASLAFDAVSIAITLSGGPAGQRFTPESLTRPTGFNGVDGQVRLLADGTSERGLAVLEVQELGATVIDPPPATFGRGEASAGPRLN